MASVSSSASRPAVAPASGSFDWFLTIAVVACIAACVRAIYFTPMDAMLGQAQKILYVHVPAAIMGLYLSCGLLAICSLVYLWIRDERLDRLAESSAEVGLVFMGIVLITGPVWARTSWGTRVCRSKRTPASAAIPGASNASAPRRSSTATARRTARSPSGPRRSTPRTSR
jgi:heme exporter protein C